MTSSKKFPSSFLKFSIGFECSFQLSNYNVFVVDVLFTAAFSRDQPGNEKYFWNCRCNFISHGRQISGNSNCFSRSVGLSVSPSIRWSINVSFCPFVRPSVHRSVILLKTFLKFQPFSLFLQQFRSVLGVYVSCICICAFDIVLSLPNRRQLMPCVELVMWQSIAIVIAIVSANVR